MPYTKAKIEMLSVWRAGVSGAGARSNSKVFNISHTSSIMYNIKLLILLYIIYNCIIHNRRDTIQYQYLRSIKICFSEVHIPGDMKQWAFVDILFRRRSRLIDALSARLPLPIHRLGRERAGEPRV